MALQFPRAALRPQPPRRPAAAGPADHRLPPRPTTTAGCGARERLPTVPADRRDDPHDLIHLLDRQQPAERPAVSRLAAALPSGGRRIRPRWCLGRIRRRGTGETCRGLAQADFQVPDALLQGHHQRLGCARGRGPDLRRQGQDGQFHRPWYTASPLAVQPPVTRGPERLPISHHKGRQPLVK